MCILSNSPFCLHLFLPLILLLTQQPIPSLMLEVVLSHLAIMALDVITPLICSSYIYNSQIQSLINYRKTWIRDVLSPWCITPCWIVGLRCISVSIMLVLSKHLSIVYKGFSWIISTWEDAYGHKLFFISGTHVVPLSWGSRGSIKTLLFIEIIIGWLLWHKEVVVYTYRNLIFIFCFYRNPLGYCRMQSYLKIR